MKFIKNIYYHLGLNWKKYLLCFIIGAAICVLSISLNGRFDLLVSYVNGLFSGGFVVLCLGGLSIVSYHGAFDMFSYAFSKRDTKKQGYYNYSITGKERRTKRKYNYIPYFAIATLFIVVSLILSAFI